eukprot:3101446-Rhodomonas_salina.2
MLALKHGKKGRKRGKELVVERTWDAGITLSSPTTHSLAPRRTSAASRLESWSPSRNSLMPITWDPNSKV